jgi:hypothetical protein
MHGVNDVRDTEINTSEYYSFDVKLSIEKLGKV